MNPSVAVHIHRQQILELACQHGLPDIRVFGSVQRGEDTGDSDLDWLVEAPAGTTLLDLVGLQQAIEDLLGIRVEVLIPEDLPPSFRDKVLREATPL